MRELSSSFTFFYKFVFFFIWFIGIGFSLRVQIFTPEAIDGRWLQYVGMWLGVSIFIFFTTGSIKKVSLEGKDLIVSNFLKNEKIPLSQIETIDGSSFLSPKLIWFNLKERSAFGKRITFLPQHRVGSGLGKHPLVHELTQEFGLEKKS